MIHCTKHDKIIKNLIPSNFIRLGFTNPMASQMKPEPKNQCPLLLPP